MTQTDAEVQGRSEQGDTGAVSIALSIVSTSLLLREGLVAMLPARLTLSTVASYAAMTPPASTLPNPPRHVVLIDSSGGRQAATTWIKYWRSFTPPPNVIVLELINDVDVILACVEAGASGYTLRGASVADVADAIQGAAAGLAECSAEVTAHLFARLAEYAAHTTPPPVSTPLTKRELEVLHHVANGRSNQEIADLLVIEVRTVKHHVHNILAKLQLRHRWEAARVAHAEGWIKLDGFTS